MTKHIFYVMDDEMLKNHSEEARGEGPVSKVTQTNIMYVSGCPPLDGVKANTTMVKDLVDYIRANTDPTTMTIDIPTDFEHIKS